MHKHTAQMSMGSTYAHTCTEQLGIGNLASWIDLLEMINNKIEHFCSLRPGLADHFPFSKTRFSTAQHIQNMSSKIQKIMFQPISLIFRYLQNKMVIQIWLYDHADQRIEGKIIVNRRHHLFLGF